MMPADHTPPTPAVEVDVAVEDRGKVAPDAAAAAAAELAAKAVAIAVEADAACEGAL